MLRPIDCLVVFEHRAARGPLRLLKAGFRHCFCALQRGDGWLICDPLKAALVVELVRTGSPLLLAQHFLATGREVMAGTAPPHHPTTLRLRPITCVELVKRMVGIDAPRVFTPYQLFLHLQRPDGAHRPFLRLSECATAELAALDSAQI